MAYCVFRMYYHQRLGKEKGIRGERERDPGEKQIPACVVKNIWKATYKCANTRARYDRRD